MGKKKKSGHKKQEGKGLDDIIVGRYEDLRAPKKYDVNHIPSAAAMRRAIVIELYEAGVDLGPKVNAMMEKGDLRDLGRNNYKSIKASMPKDVRQLIKKAYDESPAIVLPRSLHQRLETSQNRNPFLEDMKRPWEAVERDMIDVRRVLEAEYDVNKKSVHRAIYQGIMPALAAEYKSYQADIHAHIDDLVRTLPKRKGLTVSEDADTRRPITRGAPPDEAMPFKAKIVEALKNTAKVIPIIGTGAALVSGGIALNSFAAMRAEAKRIERLGYATDDQLQRLKELAGHYLSASVGELGAGLIPIPGVADIAELSMAEVAAHLKRAFDTLKRDILNNPRKLEALAVAAAADQIAEEMRDDGERITDADREAIKRELKALYDRNDPNAKRLIDGHKRLIIEHINGLGDFVREFEQKLVPLEQTRVRAYSALPFEDVPQGAEFSSGVPVRFARVLTAREAQPV